ncbi:MAG: hypothetical protein H7831_15255 [Magnetococcus sp. WYHC-3]
MFSFRRLLKEQILDEAGARELKQKYPDYDSFIDQTVSKFGNKYLLYVISILEQYKEEPPHKIFMDIVEVLEKFQQLEKSGKFDSLISKKLMKPEEKDLNYWSKKRLWELEDFCEKALDYVSAGENKKVAKEQSEILFENERFFIVHPKSMAASCYYGAQTKWCITAREANQFENYTNNGSLFIFVIDKKPLGPKYSKVAFEYETITPPWDVDPWKVWDATNQEESLSFVLRFNEGKGYWGDKETSVWVVKFVQEAMKKIEASQPRLFKNGDTVRWVNAPFLIWSEKEAVGIVDRAHEREGMEITWIFPKRVRGAMKRYNMRDAIDDGIEVVSQHYQYVPGPYETEHEPEYEEGEELRESKKYNFKKAIKNIILNTRKVL